MGQKLKGATDTGLLLAVALIVGVAWLGGAFTQIGSTVSTSGVNLCTPDKLPPGVSTLSFTAQSKDRGNPGNDVTLSYTGTIGTRQFVGQAGGTAVTVNPGDAYSMRLYNTSYFSVYRAGRLACAGSDAIGSTDFTVPNLGGVSVTVLSVANGSINSGTNATCTDSPTSGGVVQFDVKLLGNESKGYFTEPTDVGTPGYAEKYVAVLTIPPASALAYASNFDATPTTLSGCTPRTRVGTNSTGARQLVWDCSGNVGLTSPGVPDSTTHVLTVQSNSGFTPSNLLSDGNGSLTLAFFPTDVFRNTVTGDFATDFETNLGAYSAAGQSVLASITVC